MTRPQITPELVSGTSIGLRIRLLGGFHIILGERVIGETEWRLRKAASLFKLLALSPTHQLHRERALELLWPDLEPKVGTNNFHRTLHALRRILEPDRQSTWLPLQDDVLTLGPSGQLWVDVHAFEAACHAARGTSDPTTYYSTLELYTGPLLPTDRYEDWAASRRDELHGLYLSVLLDLARLHERRQELPAAVAALRRVVEGEPAHEEAHTGLMRLYARSGQRHQALRQYGQLRDALLRELDAEPDSASERLYQDIRCGRYPPTESQSLTIGGEHTAVAPRHNLPAPLTSFIGREHEVIEVRRLLTTTRLLTLIGTGGCGKTRLALEVASGPVDGYADGIWLVELAGLADPRLVPNAVAGVLGLREDADRPLIDRLSDALRSKQMLLVLDNCEHLLDACAQLVDTLLSSSPRLQVLATSREALGAMGELHWRVPSLSMPPAGTLPAAERVTEYGAVRLFVERARHRQPGFDLSAQKDMRAVIEICRQLDGIPLAIELATSRLPVLSVQQIATKLDDSLRLLTGGGRTAAPRHRTLRGVLDWSYALLNEPERDLFARLSVFAGSWTLEAAEAVGPASVADGAGGEDGLELLSRLVDRSLVQVEGHEGTVRYRLLEVIRQYGRERLEASGAADAVRRQQVAFFLELAEAAEPELVGPRQATWLKRLEREHDNIRVALAWSLERGEVESAARLAATLWRFWWIHGHLSEGRQWFRQLFASPDVLSPAVRARALRGASALAQAQSAYDEATALVEQSLALFRQLGDIEGIGNALSNLGIILACQGAYERAREVEEEGLALGRQLGDKRGIAVSLDQLGQYSYYLGDYEAAARYWEESLRLNREVEDLHSLAITLNNLGEMARDRGELDRALDRFEEAVALFRRLDARTTLVQSLQSFADLRLKRQEYAQAQALLHESVLLLRELGSTQSIAFSLESFAKLANARGLPEHAARFFGAAEALREASGAVLSSGERTGLQPSIDAARSTLGEQAWCAAWSEGKAMSLEQATEYALATVAYSPPLREAAAKASVGVLTRREREIVGLLAQGRTNRQIAQQLVLSERTVDTHGVNIMRKLGLHSRVQVADWALLQGLLPEG